MKNSVLRLALVCMVAIAVSSGADAAVIYDNGVTSANVYPVSSPNQRLADDFLLQPGATTITDIHWTGRYQSDAAIPADNFTIQIYSLDAVQPGTILKTWASSDYSLSRTESAGIYSYEAIVDPYKLVPNTVYFLSILNDPSFGLWAWAAQSSETRRYWYTTDGGVTWTVPLGVLDFQLTGPIPEPATLALFGLGLAGLGAVRRRRIVS